MSEKNPALGTPVDLMLGLLAKELKMGVLICFGMAGVNVLCALALPLHPAIQALNWAAAVFCFGMGIATAYVSRR